MFVFADKEDFKLRTIIIGRTKNHVEYELCERIHCSNIKDEQHSFRRDVEGAELKMVSRQIKNYSSSKWQMHR